MKFKPDILRKVMEISRFGEPENDHHFRDKMVEILPELK